MTAKNFSSADCPDAPPVQRGWLHWAVVVLVLVALAMAAMKFGLPGPHVDDAFAVGAAVSVSAGHGLKNPWIGDWLAEFGTDRYYSQPPVHPWVLGAWLKIWGVSTRALLAFQWLAMVITVFCVARWLVWRGASVGQALVGAMVVISLQLDKGLRHDALAFALLALGLALTAGRRSRFRWTLGYVLVALAPATLPLAAAVTIPALVWQGWRCRDELGVRIGCATAGLALAVSLVSVGIGHDWGEFFRVFTAHAASRLSGPADLWGSAFLRLSRGYEAWPNLAALAVFVGSLCVTYRCRSIVTDWLPGGVALAACLLVVFGQTFSVSLIPHVLLLAGAALAAQIPAVRPKGWIFVAVAVVLVIRHSGALVSIVVDTLDPSHAPQPEAERVAADTARSGQRLLVDHFAARTVFDYRLPANAVDWYTTLKISQPAPFARVDLNAKPARDSWLVSEFMLGRYVPQCNPQPLFLRLGTREFRSVPRMPQPVRWIP